MTILKRAALENASCECYAVISARFRQFGGPLAEPPLVVSAAS